MWKSLLQGGTLQTFDQGSALSKELEVFGFVPMCCSNIVMMAWCLRVHPSIRNRSLNLKQKLISVIFFRTGVFVDAVNCCFVGENGRSLA